MSTILSLAPQNVWKHFYSLTQVPRPSGYLKKVQEFLLNFGKSVGVESFQDEAGNIIYRKPATPGMENRKKVILQAHMDMVPQKNNDTVHDFENDPIETYIDGDWVKAKGTTLGADDGMGVAAIMAIMEDKTLKHGALEALPKLWRNLRKMLQAVELKSSLPLPAWLPHFPVSLLQIPHCLLSVSPLKVLFLMA